MLIQQDNYIHAYGSACCWLVTFYAIHHISDLDARNGLHNPKPASLHSHAEGFGGTAYLAFTNFRLPSSKRI